MISRYTLFPFVMALAVIVGVASIRAAEPAAPLNIVVIIADDLGWGDLSCQGAKTIKTPNIDALARRGIRFSNSYAAAAQCSPSRAAMLTGRYPARLHITTWIGSQDYTDPNFFLPKQRSELPLEEITLPEALKPLGYRSLQLGKWHIGEAPYGPLKQGFDEEHGYWPKAAPHRWFAPYGMSNVPTREDGEYITDRLGDEAVDFIRREKNHPFLVYLQNYAPHSPHQAKESDIEIFSNEGRPLKKGEHHATYLAMIKCIDDNVGKITAELDKLGLTERTLVVFTSDNGATPDGSNAPLAGWKKWPQEGGIRVPFIIAYPASITPGQVIDEPVITMDLTPTLLDLAGLAPERQPEMDGVSLRPLFTDPASFDRQQLFWHFPQIVVEGNNKITPYGIVREGNLKYLHYYLGDKPDELHDLAADPTEKVNLATKRPEDVQRLASLLAAHLKETGAQQVTRKP